MASQAIIWQGDKAPTHVAFLSRDGRLVLTYPTYFTGKSATITVRELPVGKERFHVEHPRRFGLQLLAQFSPGARWLAAFELVSLGSMSPSNVPAAGTALVPFDMPGQAKTGWTASIWDAATGDKQMELQGASSVEEFQFSPDDQFLALALRDGSVQVWDVTGQRHLFDWQAWPRDAASGTPTGTSRFLSFTPDSRTLAILNSESDRLELLDLRQLNNQFVAAGLDWTKETNR